MKRAPCQHLRRRRTTSLLLSSKQVELAILFRLWLIGDSGSYGLQTGHATLTAAAYQVGFKPEPPIDAYVTSPYDEKQDLSSFCIQKAV